MYALQTVGSTTSSVKDDTEVLELEDTANSIAEHIISTSNAIKRSGNLTANGGYYSSQSNFETKNEENHTKDDRPIGLCFWSLFQAVGLTCITAIICQSIIYRNGFFDATSYTNSTSITKEQFSNWHYALTTIGFVYLYANSVFMIKDKKSEVSLTYVMLHTFAYSVSALGLYAIYVKKEMGKSKDTPFYYGHMYSLHGWIGVLAAILFTIQWLSAAFTFIMPCLRSVGLPLGRTFSLYTALVSSIALITGVNGYAVHALKEEYKHFSPESLILNGYGMLVLVFLFLTFHVIIKSNKK